ncbi:hypothetical protein GE118_00675 [Mycoplasma sp. NEAQ87857]|uniref:DUF6088 family protein n=1 Tax=Mycoplasma sp. NEAQ87857 TaxID=2683967 RepID=UPI001316DD09|nr:DUF6088 family protein [Mycoplasma sp. NEAQ87857]QGZ97315.1 hypothetical protein GE118_00675 [Mycoplasma sp. NEAQ87857]
MESITKQIEHIMTENEGKIYTVNDFYHLGSKNAIKATLTRLSNQNKIARLVDGLYMVPEYSEIIKEYCFPDIDEVARKIAEKFAWTIVPTDVSAMNYTGLWPQISNAYVYASDGPSKEYMYKGWKITFKHTSKRNISNYSKELALVIQAITILGKDKVRRIDIERLSWFNNFIKGDLKLEAKKLPYWIQEVLQKVQDTNYE